MFSTKVYIKNITPNYSYIVRNELTLEHYIETYIWLGFWWNSLAAHDICDINSLLHWSHVASHDTCLIIGVLYVVIG